MSSKANIKKTENSRKDADIILHGLVQLKWFIESVKNNTLKANRNFNSSFDPSEITSELYLILHEKSPQLIVDLHEKNQLRFFTIRILLNMFQSKRHPIWKKCGLMETVEMVNEFSEEEFTIINEDFNINEVKSQSIVNAVKTAKQNAKQQTIILWNSYEELGRISKVANLYGTSYRYAENHIKKFKEQVKEYYREEIRKKT